MALSARTKVVVGMALVALATAAAAQDRADFKGVSLGASQTEFREKNPLFRCNDRFCNLDGLNLADCRQPMHDPAYRACMDAHKAAATYATVPALMHATFQNDALAQVTILFQPRDFQTIADALSQRYGKPRSRKSEVLQNRMGATLENEVLMWDAGGDLIRVTRYGSNITRGSVILIAREEAQRMESERNSRKKAAPGDL